MADGHDMFHHVNSLQILTQSIAKILYIFEQFFLSYSIDIQNLGFLKELEIHQNLYSNLWNKP